VNSPETPSDSLVPVAPVTPDATDPAVADLPSLAHAEVATARRYADSSRAASTQHASDWRRFSAWCLARGLETLPADLRATELRQRQSGNPKRQTIKPGVSGGST